MNKYSPIVVLTGDTRAGKTTTCRRLARWAAAKGWSVAVVYEQLRK